ncbi:MAG: autotransporter-associated beta strand repeat-containing protein [Planctomycetaceae bacterium]|nr:autotransporter-associated beta strand repeat-containing protein [Planctomycetaceae bacterium]
MSLRRSRQAVVCVTTWAVVGAVLLRVAPAATLVWDGTGFNWNVLSSWSQVSNSTTPDPAAKPGPNDTAVFNIEAMNSRQDVLMAGPQSIRGLVFSSLGHIRLVGSVGGLTPTELTVGQGGIYSSGASIHETAEDVVIKLAGAQTWTSDGVLGDVAINVNGPINIGSNRLTFDGSAATVLFGPLSGTGGVTKQGSGILSLRSSNTFTGDLLILGGAVGLFDNGALNAASPVAVGFGASGTLDLFGQSVVVSGLTTAPGPTSAVVENGSSNVATLTVAVSAATPNVFAGVIRDDFAALNLTKTGAGVLTLSGSNTYTGATTIEQGTLKVDGSLARGVLVKSGAFLAGAGTIGQTVVVQAGGALAPGASAGRLTVGALTMQNGATLNMEIGGLLPGSQHDQIDTAGLDFGVLALNGTLSVSLINGFSPSAGQSFDLFNSSSLSGAFDAITLPPLSNGLAWNTSQLYVTGALTVAVNGDFDLDGDVDGHDFLAWQRNPGVGNLADLKSNFGFGTLIAAAEAAAPAPEPSGLLLMALAALRCIAGRRPWN